MKKAEIAVGKFYTDGKNGLREVTGEGHQFRPWPTVADHDALEYVTHSLLGPVTSRITRAAFAAWAAAEVPADEVEQWHLGRHARAVVKRLTEPQKAFLREFDQHLKPTSLIETERGGFRVAKGCKVKGLVQVLPDKLEAAETHFELQFTALGAAVIDALHSDVR